jgi:hypothetical protein
VIAFQHDVPGWGWGGRVLGGTSTTCIIDQDIPAEIVAAPTTYDIKIIHSDDTIETYDIVSVSGKTITIGGGDTFSPAPTEDESYILGKEGSTIAEYRIQKVELTPEEEVQISATEHDANIYGDTGLEISTDESTELPDPSAFAPQVESLTIYEIFNRNGIGISFRQPEDTLVFNRADIYMSIDNVHFIKIAEGYGDDDIEYYDVSPGLTVYIKVYSINKIGIKNTTPATASLTIKGEAVGRPTAPTGLEIVGQGNNTNFEGRDCKVVWRLNAPFGGSGSLAPELPANIRVDIAGALVKDFVVQVWNSAETTLIREEITTDKWYIYSYEKNFEDGNGTLTGNFVFRIYQRNYFDKISKQYARLAVSTDKPSPPLGLTSTSEEDGVTFIWNDVSASLSDFSHYEYRTKIDSGSWSSWESSYDNKATRWLDISELANQGTERSSIEIEARIIDVFNATSVVSSTVASCNNLKGFFTVSPTSGKGHFTTIASAVTALSSNGGTVVLKEGTHQMPSGGLFLINKDIKILGEDRDLAVVRNVASDHTFIASDCSSNYVFRDFTIDSQNNNNYSYMFFTHGTGPTVASKYENNSCNMEIENIKFFLKDNKTPGSSSGDIGVLASYGSGKYVVRDVVASDGAQGIKLWGCDNVTIKRNEINGAQDYGINTRTYQGGPQIITDNYIKNFEKQGIYSRVEQVATTFGGIISNNYVEFFSGTYTTVDVTGILALGANSKVVGNTVIMKNPTAITHGGSSQTTDGIVAGGYSYNMIIGHNNIQMSVDHNNYAQGVVISLTASNCSVMGNQLVVQNNNHSASSYGIWSGADLGIISNNNIKMTNNASDIGINLDTTTNNNYGIGNTTYRVGVSVNDDGTNNDVTATNV